MKTALKRNLNKVVIKFQDIFFLPWNFFNNTLFCKPKSYIMSHNFKVIYYRLASLKIFTENKDKKNIFLKYYREQKATLSKQRYFQNIWTWLKVRKSTLLLSKTIFLILFLSEHWNSCHGIVSANGLLRQSDEKKYKQCHEKANSMTMSKVFRTMKCSYCFNFITGSPNNISVGKPYRSSLLILWTWSMVMWQQWL